MKSLYESILSSNNASRQQQAILDYLNSRFCPFDNDYNSYKYTVGKDSKGWYVDVDLTNNRWNHYKPQTNRADDRSLFDGWERFNNYIRRFKGNEPPEGWTTCPEFRYRNINANLSIEGWQNLEFLLDIDHIKGSLFLQDCIYNRDRKIYVDNLKVDEGVTIISNFNSIRGLDPKSFFKGKISAKEFEIV